MFTRLFVTLVAVALLGIGCADQSPTQSTATDHEELFTAEELQELAAEGETVDARGEAADAAAGWGRGHEKMETTFLVRIENVSDNMTLMLSNGETAPAPTSPGVWTVTGYRNPLFKIGRYDQGRGLEHLAEDGDPTMLAESVMNAWDVKSSGVFAIPVGDSEPGPLLPGKVFEFEITATPGDHLSFAMMFGQSNDLFYSPGPIGVRLFRGLRYPISGDITHRIKLWDAGTEVNQEPGLGPDQAPRQSGPNTGESERKRVQRVRDMFEYPSTDEVIKVTLTPIDAAA